MFEFQEPAGCDAGGGEVRANADATSNDVLPDLSPTIHRLIALQTQRVFVLKTQMRQDNATGALIRRVCGWSLDLPEKERTAAAKRAVKIITAVEKGAELDGDDATIADDLGDVIRTAALAREPFDKMRKSIEKQMEQAARELPVWPWVEAVRGFGAKGLATIVGEAGDLSGYANPAKLWKRMGLAVIGAERQRKVSGDAALEHGYSPRRRSAVWNIGEALIKQNGDGPYRALYLERKAYELARAPEMRPIHAHNRAKRYMEKRLLRDLWRAWRREG